MSQKDVILRAFRIENNDLTTRNSALFETLSEKLSTTRVGDRRLLLNDNDPNREEDLISNFHINPESNLLAASVLRIVAGDDTVSIPDHVFNESRFSLNDLDALNGIASVLKDTQYFMVSGNTVIACWFGNKTIKSLQTYINWLLERERGQFIYDLTPVSSPVSAPAVKELKQVIMAESSSMGGVINGEGSFGSKMIELKEAAMRLLLDDTPSLDESILGEMVSARLYIKFNKKPREMSQDDYDRNYGLLMKPISDLEDVRYVTKSGKSISAAEILLTKKVQVDMTTNNQISEQSLFLEMETFLREI